jgi:hypothetical protein
LNRKKPPLELPKGVEPEHEGHWAGWIKPDGSTSSVTAAHHDYMTGTPAHSYVLDHLGFDAYPDARLAGHARFLRGGGWGGPFLDLQYSGHRHDTAQHVADFIAAHHQPDMRVSIIRYADSGGGGTQSTEGYDKHQLLGWLHDRHPGITIKEDFDDIPKVGLHTPKGEKPHFDNHWAGWIQPDGSTYSMTDRAHGYEAGMEAHSPLSDELGFTSGYRGPLGFGFVRFVHGRNLKGQRFLSLGYDPSHPKASQNVADFLDAHHKKGMEITITHMHSRSSKLYGEDHYGHSKAAAKKWVKKHAPRQVAESEFMHTPFFRAMSHAAREKVREVHARKVLNPKGAWLPHGVEPEHDGEWGGFISPDGRTYSATDRRSQYHGGNAIHADLSYELGAPPHNRNGDYTLLRNHGFVRFTRSNSTWGRNNSPNFVFNFAKQHHAAASKLVSDFLDKHHKPGVQINIARDHDYSPYEGYDKEEAKEWLKSRPASPVSEEYERNPVGFWSDKGVEPEHNGSWGGWIHPDGRTYSSTDKHSGYKAGNELHRYLSKEMGFDTSRDDYEPMNHGHVRFVHGQKDWMGAGPFFSFNYRSGKGGRGAAGSHKLISDFLDKHYKPGARIHISDKRDYDSVDVHDVEHAKKWMASREALTSEALISRALSGESPRAIIEAIWPTLRSQMTSMKGKKVRPGVTLSQKKRTPFGFKAPTVVTKRPTDVSQQPTHRRYRGQELEMQDNAGEISANVYGVHDLADLEIQRQQKGARPIVMRGE